MSHVSVIIFNVKLRLLSLLAAASVCSFCAVDLFDSAFGLLMHIRTAFSSQAFISSPLHRAFVLRRIWYRCYPMLALPHEVGLRVVAGLQEPKPANIGSEMGPK